MEDILASIRRIIAEDQALFAGEVPEPAADARTPSDEPLASRETASSVAGAFNALIASRFAERSEVILAMTREELRPLLTAWLDAHLPPLVERLVREEIERMTAQGV
ncbi:PopZ family protein [Methylocella sp.]|uniref:PopZ family protein n=1 Tax=Methylocella sp. TaxID=1978226 RepID=UPI0037830849